MADGGRRAGGGLLAALLLVAASAVLACGGDDDDAPNVQPATATATRAATTTGAPADVAARVRALEAPSQLVDGLALGKQDAPATLQVYEDFQCPNCLFFTIAYEQVIIDEYVKTGKLRYEFHNFPILGNESVYAAVAAVCAAEQGKFRELQEKLFLVQAEADQLRQEKLNVGRFLPAALTGYAKEIGLDDAAFSLCLESSRSLQTVQDDFNAARTAGLRGTPGFVLNGTVVAYPNSIDAFRQLLDAAITK